MENLQKLFDYYCMTNPTSGKISEASNMLIHACEALDIDGPEEIREKYFEQLPDALDHFFGANSDKAIQDKSTLAEMIGRFGPINGWEKPFRKILQDEDSNLRQFCLQTLEFCGRREPELVLPYIEETFKLKDMLMRNVAATLVGKLYQAGNDGLIREVIRGWYEAGQKMFVQEIYSQIRLRKGSDASVQKLTELREWMQREFFFS